MKNFNEQTTVGQLSETLDISAVFSRMFTFEQECTYNGIQVSPAWRLD